MDGVTVLKEYAWRDLSLLAVLPAMCMIIILFVLICKFAYDSFHYMEFGNMFLFGSFALAIAIFICWASIEIYKECKPIYTRYVVTVDDSVDFNEFTNRYKIISDDGKMYTVQERE